jgi:hypothetical protein
VTGKIYEFDNNATVGAGNITVTIGGSAAATITALIDAINNNPPTPVAIPAAVDPVNAETARLQGAFNGAAGNLALVKSGANIEISGAAMTGGEGSGNQTLHRGEYVVTALDVLAGNVMIETGLQGPRIESIDVIDTVDVTKYVTSKIKILGTALQIDFDGATNPAAGDRIVWGAYE